MNTPTRLVLANARQKRLTENLVQIAKFYCHATQRLAEHPASPEETLFGLDNCLSSTFGNFRSPPCIHALLDLCEALWLKTDKSDKTIPPLMKVHLAAWYDIVGGSRPSFVPAAAQSQSQGVSCIQHLIKYSSLNNVPGI